jgi:amino acid transporter
MRLSAENQADAWIIAMALYSAGFAGYVRALLPWHTPDWSGKAIGIGLILVVVVVDLVGTKLVGRAETAVIAVELVILLTFVVLGLTRSDPARFQAGGGPGWLGCCSPPDSFSSPVRASASSPFSWGNRQSDEPAAARDVSGNGASL